MDNRESQGQDADNGIQLLLWKDSFQLIQTIDNGDRPCFLYMFIFAVFIRCTNFFWRARSIFLMILLIQVEVLLKLLSYLTFGQELTHRTLNTSVAMT